MNTKKVNRLEIIDFTKCKHCAGTGEIITPTDSAAGQTISFKKKCPSCHGMGIPGRSVVFWDDKKKIELSLQDDGRTLKVLVDYKGVDENGDIRE